jgi:membrane protease subunit (stomatin/prohibitin family)
MKTYKIFVALENDTLHFTGITYYTSIENGRLLSLYDGKKAITINMDKIIYYTSEEE